MQRGPVPGDRGLFLEHPLAVGCIEPATSAGLSVRFVSRPDPWTSSRPSPNFWWYWSSARRRRRVLRNRRWLLTPELAANKAQQHRVLAKRAGSQSPCSFVEEMERGLQTVRTVTEKKDLMTVPPSVRCSALRPTKFAEAANQLLVGACEPCMGAAQDNPEQSGNEAPFDPHVALRAAQADRGPDAMVRGAARLAGCRSMSGRIVVACQAIHEICPQMIRNTSP